MGAAADFPQVHNVLLPILEATLPSRPAKPLPLQASSVPTRTTQRQIMIGEPHHVFSNVLIIEISTQPFLAIFCNNFRSAVRFPSKITISSANNNYFIFNFLILISFLFSNWISSICRTILNKSNDKGHLSFLFLNFLKMLLPKNSSPHQLLLLNTRMDFDYLIL